MPSRKSDAAQGRAQLYFALADALTEPQADLPHVLLEAVAAGVELAGSAACEMAAPRLRAVQTMPPDVVTAAYRMVTFGAGGRPLALFESLHRQGRLAGEATAEVNAFYRSLGVTPAAGELPDHASVELAFLGELATVEGTALLEGDWELAARVRTAQRSFLRSHAATWLPAVGDQLSATGAPLYAPTGALLRDYLTEELTPRRSQVKSTAILPVLLDADRCTLCGLCTGVCPPGALWIAEDDHATSLTLDMVRCTGCERCVRTCPERVLGMVQAADRTTQPSTLTTSARVTCPQCGQPTVSEAELQAVFRRLQPGGPLDAAMQRRFSLCVTCKSMI